MLTVLPRALCSSGRDWEPLIVLQTSSSQSPSGVFALVLPLSSVLFAMALDLILLDAPVYFRLKQTKREKQQQQNVLAQALLELDLFMTFVPYACSQQKP